MNTRQALCLTAWESGLANRNILLWAELYEKAKIHVPLPVYSQEQKSLTHVLTHDKVT